MPLLFAALASGLNNRSQKALFRSLRGALALGLVAFLFFAPLGLKVFAQKTGSAVPIPVSKAPDAESFINYVDERGEVVCREATPVETSELNKIDTSGLGMRRISPVNLQPDYMTQGDPDASENINADGEPTKIILRGTSQLEEFPEAKAAFIRAALIWEAKIQSQFKIYIDVDYGPTRFGQSWGGVNALGSTSSYSREYPYQDVRQSLIAGASTASEASLYNSLPATALPTNTGEAGYITVAEAIARALGLMEPIAPETDPAPRVSFNSFYKFDFNPTDGIDADKYDFEAVAVHEIGHALGFISRAGRDDATPPAVWDIFRFREGTALDAFGTTERVMTADGLQYYFSGGEDLSLSTGGSDGRAPGGDGIQSSHWKNPANNYGVYIGIMAAPLGTGVRREITVHDTNALNFFGYNMDPTAAPPPAPANDLYANARELSGCVGSIEGTNMSAKREPNEPWHGADGSSVWYRWKALSGNYVKFDTVGARTNYDTTVAIYSGESMDSLSLIGWENGFGNATEVGFAPTAGTTYTILVDGYAGQEGNFTLNWSQIGCAARASQSIDFQPLPNRTYGDAPFALSATASSGLPVSFTVASGPAAIYGNTLNIIGAGTVVVTAYQSGDSSYSSAPSVEQSFTVAKATAPITLGNLNQSYDGSARRATVTTNPAGMSVTISYSQNGVPVQSPVNPGSYGVTATINNPNYQGTATGTLVIDKATPVVTWSNPADITYGTALSGAQLNATASVAGTFSYTPAAGTRLNAGSQSLTVNFTPTDTATYASISKTVYINVLKATPVVDWNYPAEITYGTALSGAQLNATASVAGAFAYTPSQGTILNAGGAQPLSVNFTPSDTTNYNSVSKTVSIAVLKATPVITWSNPADITYGQQLGSGQLNATSPVAGSFAYSPAEGSVLDAGPAQTLIVYFRPTDNANYNPATKYVQINVLKATPVITWHNPADITYGTPLSATQLNATVNFMGSLQYTPALGTVLSPGAGQTLSVNFIPVNSVNYNTVSRSVLINVGKSGQTITFAALPNRTFGDADFSVAAYASSGLPVSFSAAGNCVISGGTVHLTAAGSCTITASQAGDGHYGAASEVVRSFNISKAGQAITFAALAGRTFGDADFSVGATASSGLPVTFSAAGSCVLSGSTVHLTAAGSCTVTASQAGNGNYGAATDVSRSFNISRASTATAISSSANPSEAGQSVTFTATVSSAAGAPIGAVQFKADGNNLGAPVPVNAAGAATLSTSDLSVGTHTITAEYGGDLNFWASTATLAGMQTVNSPPKLIQLDSASYGIREDAVNTPQGFGLISVDVTRTGDTTAAATVQYSTADTSGGNECNQITGQASQRCDYLLVAGTLRFNAGEAKKTIHIPVINDGYSEGAEFFSIRLRNPSGGDLGATAQATVTIEDDALDATPATGADNAYLSNAFFVRMNYLDFLGREPDASGFNDWTNVLNSCGPEKGFLGAPYNCDRAHVSHGFFGSPEFTNAGFRIYRLYEVGMNRLPRYAEFTPDMASLSGHGLSDEVRERNLADYLQQFSSRQEFIDRFHGALQPSEAALLIQRLEQTAGVTLPATATTNPGQPQQYGRDELIRKRASGEFTVGQTLNAFIEQQAVYDWYFPRGQVTMLYFAYLKRDPDLNDPNLSGWNEWVHVFTNGGAERGRPDIGPRDIHHLIFGFIYSEEYRKRFGQP